MNIAFWQLGWRSFRRDLRAGDLRLLIVAVTLAVAALSTVGFFADRLKGALQRDASAMLGGDVVLSSANPLPPVFVTRAQALGLATVQTLAFPTMSRAAQTGISKLVALKAVSRAYPLRGQLIISAAPDAAPHSADGIVQPGQAWVEAGLLAALDLSMGQSLLLGESRLRVTRVIVSEPDRGTGFMNFAPRVLINQHDLQATQLIQPASRVSYRLALAGAAPAIQQYRRWAQEQLKTLRAVRLESIESGPADMGRTLARAEQFLNLIALLCSLLSAVAVALAARSFAAKHLDNCAMLRVLGVKQRSMAAAYSFEFFLAGVLASALGLLLGFALHYAFVVLLSSLLSTTLPAASVWPLLLGSGMGLTLLLAFGLPPVLQLANVPPLRVIRREVGSLQPASLGTLALGLAGFAALLLAVSSDVMLGLIAVGGFAAAVLVFAALSWLAVKLLRWSVNEATAAPAVVLATRQLAARPAYAVVQISALAVGLLALILLTLVRTDFIAAWHQTLPSAAPDRFVINILPAQREAFIKALRDAAIEDFDWYPMIRSRLTAVNGRPVSADNYSDERARHLVEREFNLSARATLPQQNQVVAGRWRVGERNAISVEQGLAKTLNLRLGDRLTFDLGGVPTESTITSLRKVNWGSMRANFFAMYPVDELPDAPLTYLSAFKAPAASAAFDNALVRQFPNITSVDMTATLAQVQRVLDQVIAAVEFLFAFTLAAALLVLFASVAASRSERTREFALMRALGAKNRLLRQVQRAELTGVGLLAGLLAAALALLLAWALARYVFEFDWTPSLWVPLWGALGGAALALAAGWWGLREVLHQPVMQTLRQAQG